MVDNIVECKRGLVGVQELKQQRQKRWIREFILCTRKIQNRLAEFASILNMIEFEIPLLCLQNIQKRNSGSPRFIATGCVTQQLWVSKKSTYLDSIGQDVNSLEHSIAALNTELDLFAHETKSSGIVALSRGGSKASLQSCSKHDEINRCFVECM